MLTKRSTGFSLIELMIVLSIVAILSLLAGPAFSQWMANARIRSTADSFQNGLRLAQTEAIARNRQVAFVLTNSTPTSAATSSTPATTAINWVIYALPLLNSAEGANSTANTTTFIQSNISNSSSDTKITGSANSICFNSVGRLVTQSVAIADAGNATCTAPATNSPITFAVANTNGDRPLTVQLYLGGQIRLCDPSKALATNPDGCS